MNVWKPGGRINNEEQVKVVIRLKPDDPTLKLPHCVHLSNQPG